MSKKKLAGIIVGCIVAIIVIIAIVIPSLTPESAQFEVSNLHISPEEAEPGQTVTVGAEVQNVGEEKGTHELELIVNGAVMHSESVTLDGGETAPVSFSFEILETDVKGLYTVELAGLTGSFLVTEPSPSAEFTITGFDQIYSYVYIYYKIRNTGEAHIRYYKVDFTITYDDGSQYEDWTNGVHVFIGQELPRSRIYSVGNKNVTSVEVANLELKGGSIPDEITSVDFDITGFRQTYYEALEEWSAHVYVDYTVQSTGAEYVDYYRAYITVTCDDGSQYYDEIYVDNILAGEKWTDSDSVYVSSKKVISVELADWGALALAGTPPAVVYKITGTAEEVDVTLSNPTGGTEQYSSVSLPEKYSYTSFPDSFTYISAQNQGASGTVIVSIYVNGTLFKTSSSSGAYVIATASGLK